MRRAALAMAYVVGILVAGGVADARKPWRRVLRRPLRPPLRLTRWVLDRRLLRRTVRQPRPSLAAGCTER